MRNTLFPTLKWSLLVLMTSLLTACGFHLRGDYDIPQELSRMSLTSYDQYSTFTRMVHRQLRLNKINLQAPAEIYLICICSVKVLVNAPYRFIKTRVQPKLS